MNKYLLHAQKLGLDRLDELRDAMSSKENFDAVQSSVLVSFLAFVMKDLQEGGLTHRDWWVDDSEVRSQLRMALTAARKRAAWGDVMMYAGMLHANHCLNSANGLENVKEE